MDIAEDRNDWETKKPLPEVWWWWTAKWPKKSPEQPKPEESQ